MRLGQRKADHGSPEMMGAVCAMVYLFIVIFFIPWPFYKDIVVATSGGGNRDVIKELQQVETGRLLHRFPHNKLASFLGAILSLQCIVLLGIGDDLFDIRWRHKVLIPAVASIPMLVVYFVDFGVTQMVVPLPLRPYLGELFDLGRFCDASHRCCVTLTKSRLGLLRLHGTVVHLFLEQHQHPRRHQRYRGCSIDRDCSTDSWQRHALFIALHHLSPSSNRLASIFTILPTAVYWGILCAAEAQLVSCEGICWRYLLLLFWHGVCSSGNSGPLQQDVDSVAAAASVQLSVLGSSVVPPHTVSPTSAATLQCTDRSTGAIARTVSETSAKTDSGEPQSATPASAARPRGRREGAGALIVQFDANQFMAGVVRPHAGGSAGVGIIGVSICSGSIGAVCSTSHGTAHLHGGQLVREQCLRAWAWRRILH